MISNVCCWIIGIVLVVLLACCCFMGIQLGKINRKCGRCVYYDSKTGSNEQKENQ